MVYVKKNVLQVTVLRISSPALEMELFLAVFSVKLKQKDELKQQKIFGKI